MRRYAIWCTGHRKTVILAWIIALLGVGALGAAVGSEYSEEFTLPGADSEKALKLLEERFPAESGETATIVFRSPVGVERAAVRQRMQRAFAAVEREPHVLTVESPFGTGSTGTIGPNGKIAYATVQFDVTGEDVDTDEVRRVMDAALAPAGEDLRVAIGGQPVELVQAEEEGDSSFTVGLLAAVVVLLMTFGSAVAMGLPIVTALFALGVGLSLVTLGTHLFSTASFALQLAAMIGLGVGVDYALFILTRFRNGLDEGLEPREAAVTAIDTAGRAVLFAGTTVIIALMGMMLLGLSFLYGVAMAAAFAVLMTMTAALTLLPSLLAIAGHRVNRLRVPGLGGSPPSTAEDTRWFRWSRGIQRRPVLAALLSGGLLILLCVPTLSLRLGSTDAGTDPAGTTTREAYELLAEGFGPGFNGPFSIVAALPGERQDGGLERLRRSLEREEGVAATTPVALNPAGDAAVFEVFPTTSPQSEATTELLHRIRDDQIPPVEEATGARIHVGGINAIFADFGREIAEKLPLFIGVVVLLSALLLMAVFRSLLVPLKAIGMNLLSIGAAFGIIVAVFQWGWGSELIGVDTTGPIVSFFPIFLFAIIFGLSMDYEVFLMSRIREEWVRRGDATVAVTRGLALTGRVITAAATIMVTVFASFVLGDNRIIKLFGLGLAAAVLIDAVVIRTILVPALMQLFGRRAWWLPAWLDRALPRLNVEPQGNAPQAGADRPARGLRPTS